MAGPPTLVKAFRVSTLNQSITQSIDISVMIADGYGLSKDVSLSGNLCFPLALSLLRQSFHCR